MNALAIKLPAFFLVLATAALLLTPYFYWAPLVPLALASLVALYHKPFIGLLLLAFFVPLEALFAGNRFLTGAKITAIAMIFLIGLRLLTGQTSWRQVTSSQWYLIAALAGIFGIGSLFSPWQALSLEATGNLITAAAVFGITLAAAERLDLRYFMNAVVLSVSIASVVSLLSPERAAEDRVIGLLADPNYFAMLLVTAIPLGLFLLMKAHTHAMRLFWAATLVLNLVVLQQTLSRSGLLVLCVVGLMLLWHYRHRISAVFKPERLGIVLTLGFVSIVTVALLTPQTYVDRMRSLADFSGVKTFEDRALGRRASYLVVGTRIFSENPVTGAGPGTFPVYYAQSGFASAFSEGMSEPELYRRAHNTWLELLAETGIIGFLVFLLLAGTGIRNFYRARQKALRTNQRYRADEMAHLGATFGGILLFLLFLSAPDHKYLWILLAISHLSVNQRESQDTL